MGTRLLRWVSDQIGPPKAHGIRRLPIGGRDHLARLNHLMKDPTMSDYDFYDHCDAAADAWDDRVLAVIRSTPDYQEAIRQLEETEQELWDETDPIAAHALLMRSDTITSIIEQMTDPEGDFWASAEDALREVDDEPMGGPR